jgi:DHA2 family multidrug resistance protein
MTPLAAVPNREKTSTAAFLVTGILIAALAEAIASTALSLGRDDVIGDTYATPDEFAWLEVSYTALKLMGFVATPWLMTRMNPRNAMLLSVLAMGLACGFAALTACLDILTALRMIQGFAGGVLLVAGQATIFLVYPLPRQPMLQALFAIGSVVAPATMVPAFQGWLLDNLSWAWVFFSILPITLAAAGLMLLADKPATPMGVLRPFDWIGFSLVSVSFWCFTFVLNQGSRWDWFEEPRMLCWAILGVTSLLGFLAQQSITKGHRLLDFSVFQSQNFSFAFIVSFVAGTALLGSSYLIPSFVTSILAFTPTAVGELLLPSSVFFIGALLLAAFLVQACRVSPIATVPFGILMIVVAMWMLSGSTNESGVDDMMVAVLLRGLGLGFLFLSITLIAFSKLTVENLSSGIAIFNAGRLVGGLMGIAWLQTTIAHHVAGNFSVLGAHLTAGTLTVGERLATTTAMLASRGMDVEAASRGAMTLLVRTVTGQSTVIAFETAFTSIALLLIAVAPLMAAVKFALGRYARIGTTLMLNVNRPKQSRCLRARGDSDRQREVKSCSPQRRLIISSDGSAVRLNDGAADPQPHTHAAALGCEETIE